MTEEQIEEAVGAVAVSATASMFLNGTMYSSERFQEELGRIVNHIKSHVGAPA